MNGWDILLLLLIAAALAMAVRSVVRGRKKAKSCPGSCEGCPGCGADRR